MENITRFKVPDEEKLEQVCNEFILHDIIMQIIKWNEPYLCK